jgi:hypothetical protein
MHVAAALLLSLCMVLAQTALASGNYLRFISPTASEEFVGDTVDAIFEAHCPDLFVGHLCIVLNTVAQCSDHVSFTSSTPATYRIEIKLPSPGHHRLLGVLLPSGSSHPPDMTALQLRVKVRSKSDVTEVGFRTWPLRDSASDDERVFYQSVVIGTRTVSLQYGGDPLETATKACGNALQHGDDPFEMCLATLLPALRSRVERVNPHSLNDSSKPAIAVANAYVSNRPESGGVQLAILRAHGLQPHHRVLEIGCGTLSLARHLLKVLHPGHYACIEPNDWFVNPTARALY